jgi:hypothetical protein
MGMRDLAIKAMAMRNQGKQSDEIRRFVHQGMQVVSMQDGGKPFTEVDRSNGGWQMRRTSSGEIIVYDPDQGYFYRPS